MNIVDLSDKRTETFPNSTALFFQDEAYSSSQLNQMGRQLATGLQSLGIKRGDHVVVSMPNTPEVFACFQAIWRIGAVIIPVMFLMGENETRSVLEESDAKLIITSHDLVEKMQNVTRGNERIKHVIALGAEDDGKIVGFESLLDRSAPLETTEQMADDDVALMLFTSGTTGKPKGVMTTHNNLYSNAVNGAAADQWDKAPISILCLPLAHAFGILAMNTANLSPYEDTCGVLMSWFDPEEVFHLIQKYKANRFFGVPTMYQVLLMHPASDAYDTSSLERCLISAAPVTEELHRAFSEKFSCTMYEGYGCTEASASIAVCRPDMPFKKGSCGVPLPGVEVKIVDVNDNELPVQEQGEILAKGDNIMKGYYKKPQETEEALRGGWLHTGDVGYVDEEGYLYITDRIKDMIIKGGYNIYPSEIENCLAEHPAILEIAVIGIPDEKYGEEVMAHIVLNANQELTEDEVIEFAKSRLTPFKCPAQVRFTDSLPKTPIGKILKKELRNIR